MSREQSNLFPNLQFGHYYQLNSTSEAVRVVDQERSNSPINATAKKSGTSDRGIIFALGFIAMLLVFSGMQLYRSFNANPVKAKVVKSKASRFSSEEIDVQIPGAGFSQKINNQKLEIFAIKNAISRGKF